ncbi:MAG: hypothetical protein WA944_16455 [Mycobacterium sp.]
MEVLRDVVVLLHLVGLRGDVRGMGNARQRRTGDAVPRPIFVGVGVLAFMAAAVAVLW